MVKLMLNTLNGNGNRASFNVRVCTLTRVCLGLALLTQATATLAAKVKVTVYDEINHECCQTATTVGCKPCQTIRFEENQCVSFGFYGFAYKISSIDPHGGCVKIWEGQNCTGESLRIVTGSTCPYQNLGLCAMNTNTITDSGNRTWNNQVVGVSGCAYVGDPMPAPRLDKWTAPPSATTTITAGATVHFTVYDKEDHDCCETTSGCRTCESVSINDDECFTFLWFGFAREVSSINTNGGCVQIWDGKNCTGESRTFDASPSSNTTAKAKGQGDGSFCPQNDLGKCLMKSGQKTWDNRLVGVSGCKFDRKTVSAATPARWTMSPTTAKISTITRFTVYDRQNFYCCESPLFCYTCQSFSIADDQCVSFHYEGWAYKVSSIDTNKGCVRIWEAQNCTGESLRVGNGNGSSCTGEQLNNCAMAMSSGSGNRNWDNKLVGVSGCKFNGSSTPAPRFGLVNRSAEMRLERTECPNGTWVMEVRVKPGQVFGLEMDCFAPGAEVETETIMAARGLIVARGNWTRCDSRPMQRLVFYPEDSVVYGYCEYHRNSTGTGRIKYDGTACYVPETAVCGVNIASRGSEMLDVFPVCCPIPNPGSNCSPTDKFEAIETKNCDNIGGHTPTNCTYRMFVGLSFNTQTPAHSRLSKFYSGFYDEGVQPEHVHGSNSSSSLKSSLGTQLASNFESILGVSNLTLYNWATKSETLWRLGQTSQTVSFEVPPDTRSVVEQVVGVCGFLEARPGQVRRTDYDRDGNEIIPVPENTEGPMSMSTTAILATGVGIPAAVLITAGLLYFWYRKYGGRKQQLTNKEIQLFLNGEATGNSGYTPLTWNNAPYNQEYEVCKGNLTIDLERELGSGQFGVVYKGTLKQQDTELAVAVKTVRQGTPKELCLALMSELKILAHIGHHENIANLMGSYSENVKNLELYVGVELCAGSLLQFLRHNRYTFEDFINPGSESGSDSETEETSFNEYGGQNLKYELPDPMTLSGLIQWTTEIANGMEYLASKRVVHADLAARNVLLSFDFQAKICDFGLARQLIGYEYIKKLEGECCLPWKWMAIESLAHMQFTTMSDVWSFGVTCWEIFSLGAVPYPCLAWSWDFVDRLESGQRLSQPQYASMQMYQMMLSCWHEKKEARPSFTDLKTVLQGQIQL